MVLFSNNLAFVIFNVSFIGMLTWSSLMSKVINLWFSCTFSFVKSRARVVELKTL